MRPLARAELVMMFAAAWCGLGCSGGRVLLVSPAGVARSEVVPRGYVSVGTARASCRALPGWGEFHGEPLANFACSGDRMRRVLAEQASAAGGSVLAAERCRSDAAGGRSCTATIARPGAGVSAAGVRAGDGSWEADEAPAARVVDGIRIDLEPRAQTFARRARAARDVAEPSLLPVSHVELGALRARCDAKDCGDDELRLALRMAAGGLGASALVGAHCLAFEGERSCSATLAATERDPERDANAH